MFPGQKISAHWELAFREEVDATQVVEDAAKLKSAGYRIDAAELEEKTGYKLADASQETSVTEGEDQDTGAIAMQMHANASEEISGDNGGETAAPPSEAKNDAKINNRDSEGNSVAMPTDGNGENPDRSGDSSGDRSGDPGSALVTMLAELLKGGSEAWSEVIAEAVGEGAEEGVQGFRDSGVEEEEIRNNCGIDGEGFSKGNKCAGGKGTSREPKTKADRDQFGPKYRVGMTPEEAEERLAAVIDKAIKDKKGHTGAAWREGLGRIDIPWGTPGDKQKDFEGGSGLSHIIAKHTEADARRLSRVLSMGTIGPHKGSRGKAPDPMKRIVVGENYEAILVKVKASRAWVLSGYTKKKK